MNSRTLRATARYVLFVVGTSRGVEEFEAIVRQHAMIYHGPEAQVEVVQVQGDPERAERQRVHATPCLVRELPLPQIRLVGMTRDAAHLGRALGETHDLQVFDDGEP